MPSIAIACALLFGAAATDGTTQTLLWIAAVAADYLGLLVTGTEGWRVQASHFAERHSLIVLIALGESVVDIGAACRTSALDAGVVTGRAARRRGDRGDVVGLLRRRRAGGRAPHARGAAGGARA